MITSARASSAASSSRRSPTSHVMREVCGARARAARSLRARRRGDDVVVLDQHAGRQVVAMVVAAAAAHGVALEHAQAGRGLARVGDARARSPSGSRRRRRASWWRPRSCAARSSARRVRPAGSTLPNPTRVAQMFAARDPAAVRLREPHVQPRVDLAKHLAHQVGAAEHQRLTRAHLGLTAGRGIDASRRGHVSVDRGLPRARARRHVAMRCAGSTRAMDSTKARR